MNDPSTFSHREKMFPDLSHPFRGNEELETERLSGVACSWDSYPGAIELTGLQSVSPRIGKS